MVLIDGKPGFIISRPVSVTVKHLSPVELDNLAKRIVNLLNAAEEGYEPDNW